MDWFNRIVRRSGDSASTRLRFGGRFFIFGTILLSSLLLAWTFAPSLIGQQQKTRATEHEHDSADLIRKRAEWFSHQRQYPLGFIPAGARERAIEQRDKMIREQGTMIEHLAAISNTITPNTTTWTAIGPQPTTASVNNFGNVSGRITALAVDPRDLTNNTVYLGGAVGGVWKTTDGGTNWIPKTDNMPSLAVTALALDTKTDANNTIIYAGTGEGDFGFDSYWGSGLLKSIDSGANWTSIGATSFGATAPINSITQGPFIFALAAQPNTANPALLAALRGSGMTLLSGIWRSTNGGTSWTNVFPANLAQTGNIGTDVVFDPFDVTGKTAYAAIGVPFSVQNNPLNGIYKSTDGGATWSSLNSKITTSIPSIAQTNFGRISLAVGKPASGSVGVLYASIADHSQDSTAILAFAKSIDGGQTWTKLINTPNFCAGQCWFDMVVKASPTNASLVMIGGGAVGPNFSSTVFRSTDGGNNWLDVSLTGTASETVHVDQHAGAFAPDGTKYYIGNDGGAWSSTTVTNPANTPAQVIWNNLNNTLQLTEFYPHLSIHPSNSQNIIGGAQDNGTQQFSGSLAWTDMAVCGDGGYTAFDPKTPTTIYAGCEYVAGNSGLNPLNKSVTSGASFVQIKNGINLNDAGSFIPPLVIDPTNPQTLYYGTFRVYQTTNGGTLWTPISADLTTGNGAFISTIAVAPSNSATVYVGTVDGLLWIATNAAAGSATFNEVDKAPLPPRSVTQIVVDPTNPQAAYVTFSGFASCLNGCDLGGHVFKTINGGAAWTDITGTLPDIPVNDIAIDPNDLTRKTLYLGTDIGVFGTIDGGITWSPLASGLPNVEVTTIALHEPSRTLVAGSHGRGAWSLQLPGTAAISTSTTMTSSLNPSASGQMVTFTAKVAPASGTTVPTGTVQFHVDGSNSGLPATVASCSPSPDACATFASSSLSAGSHTIVGTYSGDSTFGVSTSNTLTQTVGLISTTTTVTSSMNPSGATQVVTFTATVTFAAGTGTPTGTVQFQLDGTNTGPPTNLGICTCANISVRLNAGFHSIIAVYSGDSNFSGSTSSTFTQTVNSGNTSPVDFSFGTPSPPSATIPAGQLTMFSIPVTPSSPSSAGIMISCAGLPAATTCTSSPNPVSEGSASTLAQVTLQTTSRAVVPGSPTNPSPPWAHIELLSLLILATLCLAVAALKPDRRRRLAFGLAVGLVAVFIGLQVGCGGGGSGGGPHGTPAGTSTITITGTAGSFTHTAQFTLTVQ